jgi:hypothetical protein
VLVDGLDEISSRIARQDALDIIESACDDHRYRFVVTTRPLSTVEMQRDLAGNPLMATMLCRLSGYYHGRPLPTGRSGIYDLFVKLLTTCRGGPADELRPVLGGRYSIAAGLCRVPQRTL